MSGVFGALIGLVVVLGVLALVSWRTHTAITKTYPAMGTRHFLGGCWTHLQMMGPTESPPVILLHGAGGNSRDFTFDLAHRLARDHFVIVPDRPGLGWSTRPRVRFGLVDQAQWLEALIRHLDIDRPVIVGHSYGAALAMRHAIDYEGAAKGLVLSAPPLRAWSGDTSWYNRIGARWGIGHLMTWTLVPWVGMHRMASGIKGVFKPAPVPEGYRDHAGVELMLRPGVFRANAHDLADLNGELRSMMDHYSRISIPVVMVHGDADTIAHFDWNVLWAAQRLSSPQVAIVPSGGHMPHHDAAMLFEEHVAALHAAGDSAAHGD